MRGGGNASGRCLTKLLSRSNKATRQGIQLSEAITGDGAAIFRHACGLGLEGIVSKRIGSQYVSGRTRAWLKSKNPRGVAMRPVELASWSPIRRTVRSVEAELERLTVGR
jgi:hypothetical protein